MKEFKDKAVIVTGAGSGIGAATAKLFAENGAQVLVADIDIGTARLTVDAIDGSGGKAIAIKTDVSDLSSVQTMIDTCISHYGQIDVIVNNAGIANKHWKKTAEHTLEDWEKVIAVNQTGVFYCMKLALSQMLNQGSGNIVNVASLAGIKASGNNLAYSASKFAVVGMTKSAALEYASKNIRINAVCPSYTHSQLLHNVIGDKPDLADRILTHVPMKRFGEPEEIAQAIVYLASDKSKYITGHCLTLDGGLSL